MRNLVRCAKSPISLSLFTVKTFPRLLLIAMLFAGCEGSSSAPNQTSSGPAAPYVPPTASIAPSQPNVVTAAAPAPLQKEAEPGEEPEEDDLSAKVEISNLPEGTPEWIVREIARLRSLPTDVVRQQVPGEPDRFEVVRLTTDEARQELQRRNEKVIELAMEAIQKTNADPAKEQLFNNAVHFLADARMQLSLAGDTAQAQLMAEDAEHLYKRNKTSFAAIESAAKIVQLTQQQAQQYAAGDPQWALAFAQQARLFAEKFPGETSRAAIHLLAAGRMCDELGQREAAQLCLRTIADKFPGTPFAEQVEPSLRRLALPGNVLQEFGGTTTDGGYISIEQYRGQAVLIAFWASNSTRFREHLPFIQQAQSRFGNRLAVVGVNFDRDERSVDQFLEETGISWKQIFYSDPEKRGARNLVARHYGVTQVPAYWLVDPQGKVISVQVDPLTLEQTLVPHLGQ
ncbi:thioredoxin-like domain-containing protein [Planctomicrobium sp. SH664]|uniref:thioredoxin-like domain-containing protein n=1 Tax=Planctomicrobium sp. SH664 TaxID=3448125 RepID=UPI003F5B1DC4